MNSGQFELVNEPPSARVRQTCALATHVRQFALRDGDDALCRFLYDTGSGILACPLGMICAPRQNEKGQVHGRAKELGPVRGGLVG